tara:strand:+ start:325 stop:657 length:333 start_codon:yes stop_codon:yes gene_type:complete
VEIKTFRMEKAIFSLVVENELIFTRGSLVWTKIFVLLRGSFFGVEEDEETLGVKERVTEDDDRERNDELCSKLGESLGEFRETKFCGVLCRTEETLFEELRCFFVPMVLM